MLRFWERYIVPLRRHRLRGKAQISLQHGFRNSGRNQKQSTRFYFASPSSALLNKILLDTFVGTREYFRGVE